MFERIACVVNPMAGSGRSGELVERIRKIFLSRGIRLSIEESRSGPHAVQTAKHLASEHEVVVAVGGDGTVNDVANGIIGSKAALAVIATGSGNDFASLLKMPREKELVCDMIVQGRVKRFDAGRVVAREKQASRYFVNTFGIGFDAEVAYEAHRIPFLKGLPLYLSGLIKTLLKFQTVNFELESADGRRLSKECFMVCVGNGDREGGGFRITPDANPCDGLLDVCVIAKVPLRRVFRIVGSVLKGKHQGLTDIDYFKAKSITIRSETPVRVHADGEVYPDCLREISVEVIPGCLPVVTAAV